MYLITSCLLLISMVILSTAQEISPIGLSLTPNVTFITFIDPAQTDFCGYRPGEASPSFTLRFPDPGTDIPCFNLADLADNATSSSGKGVNIVGSQYFNASSNYSQVAVVQTSPEDGESGRAGQTTLRTFAESDCQLSGSEAVGNGEYEWNCGAGDASCAVLPAGIESLSLRRTNETEVGKRCVRANVENGASRYFAGSVFLWSVIIMSSVFLL